MTASRSRLTRTDESVNRLTESVSLFESTINSPFFANSAVYVRASPMPSSQHSILFLNKVDLLREKYWTGARVSLTWSG